MAQSKLTSFFLKNSASGEQALGNEKPESSAKSATSKTAESSIPYTEGQPLATDKVRENVGRTLGSQSFQVIPSNFFSFT